MVVRGLRSCLGWDAGVGMEDKGFGYEDWDKRGDIVDYWRIRVV